MAGTALEDAKARKWPFCFGGLGCQQQNGQQPSTPQKIKPSTRHPRHRPSPQLESTTARTANPRCRSRPGNLPVFPPKQWTAAPGGHQTLLVSPGAPCLALTLGWRLPCEQQHNPTPAAAESSRGHERPLPVLTARHNRTHARRGLGQTEHQLGTCFACSHPLHPPAPSCPVLSCPVMSGLRLAIRPTINKYQFRVS